MAKHGLLSELWAFMRVRKKWWLLPIILVLLLVGSLRGIRLLVGLLRYLPPSRAEVVDPVSLGHHDVGSPTTDQVEGQDPTRGIEDDPIVR